MVLPKQLFVHTRPVVKALYKTKRNDLHQIGVALIVFRQQNQMVIPILITSDLPVKAGIGCYIDLAAEDRIDPGRFCLPVKIDHTIHDAMIGDRRTVHTELLDPGHILFNFIRTVQQTVLCMDMQMCKIQSSSLLVYLPDLSVCDGNASLLE